MILTKKLDKLAQRPGNRNHIWVYDRSQSMYYTLRQLCDDLVEISSHIKVDDTLTLAWFSTEGGKFKTILSGFQFTGIDDAKRIQDVVNANSTTIGLTCFSEVLQDTVQTVANLKAAFPNNTFAFMFFTDGYPVVSSYQREEKAIFEQLEKLRPDIGEGLFIGYGDYYNRSLMGKMAIALGAQLVHADDLVVVDHEMKVLLSLEGSNRVTVDISDVNDVEIVFGIGSGRVVVYPISDGRAVVSSAENEIHIISKASHLSPENTEQTIYASAYAEIQQGNINKAIEWLGEIGDKYLVDLLYNAYTTAEIGEAADAVSQAVFDESKRYLDGKKKNYVPPRDVFCLVEALDLLADDPDAKFYPSHNRFQYKRIGVGRIYHDGYPKFHENTLAGSRLSDLVWNEDRLNLSIRVNIPGVIELPDSRPAHFGKTFRTYQWKTYTIIKDGNLHTTKFPCSMSKATFVALQEGKLIPKTWRWNDGEVYVLELKRIPIINRSIAEDYLNAEELAKIYMYQERCKANMKVFNNLRKQAAGDNTFSSFASRYSQDDLDFLTSVGIVARDGSFNVPSDSAEAEDYYTAMTFQLKAKGWSALPSVNDVINKKKSNAPARQMESAIEYAKTFVDFDLLDGSPQEDIVKRIDDILIKEVKLDLVRIRKYIQKAKFAVLLGHQWFSDFNGNRDNCSIDVDGTEVNFVLGETKVSF